MGYNSTMKKVFLILVLLFLALLGIFILVKQKVAHDLSQPIIPSAPSPTPTLVVSDGKETTSIFVPYWGLDTDTSEVYDRYLYFGITVDEFGIANEIGKERIPDFLEVVPDSSESLLTVRMVDSTINTKVLRNLSLQKTIIKESIAEAKRYGFSGIVLDLEVNALPFNAIVSQITDFTQSFRKQVQSEQLTFGVAIYGDAFYRARPFEVQSLAKDVDDLYVMAYDFHKSRGNPGPNFPLEGKSEYGYDYDELVEDFLGAVDPDIITVVFGMYGYDWEIDSSGNPISYGKARTLNEITSTLLSDCPYRSCTITRDVDSSETQIIYTDNTDTQHIVWFEDRESSKKKSDFLKGRGISNIGFWAYSYY